MALKALQLRSLHNHQTVKVQHELQRKQMFSAHLNLLRRSPSMKDPEAELHWEWVVCLQVWMAWVIWKLGTWVDRERTGWGLVLMKLMMRKWKYTCSFKSRRETARCKDYKKGRLDMSHGHHHRGEQSWKRHLKLSSARRTIPFFHLSPSLISWRTVLFYARLHEHPRCRSKGASITASVKPRYLPGAFKAPGL